VWQEKIYCSIFMRVAVSLPLLTPGLFAISVLTVGSVLSSPAHKISPSPVLSPSHCSNIAIHNKQEAEEVAQDTSAAVEAAAFTLEVSHFPFFPSFSIIAFFHGDARVPCCLAELTLIL
jgi:hypothetical protein